MLRFQLRLTFVCLFLLSTTLLIIHAQPYDLHEKRQRFVRDDCRAACFVGIQPGITTVEEAVERLKASDWTREVDNRTINNVSGFISWKWSDKKPAWINGDEEGNIWASQKQVVRIVIYGDLRLGDTRLTLGLPDQEVIDTTEDRKRVFSLYTATYAQAGLIIDSWQPCKVLEPLRRPVIVTYTVPVSPALFPAEDALADLRHSCPYQ